MGLAGKYPGTAKGPYGFKVGLLIGGDGPYGGTGRKAEGAGGGNAGPIGSAK